MIRTFLTAAVVSALLLATSCTTEQDLSNLIEQRIQALKKKDIDAFLQGDYYYVLETEKMTESLPKVLWEKEKDKIKQKHKPRFDEIIQQIPVASKSEHGLNPAGVLLFSQMTSKILEVQRSANVLTREGKTQLGSKVFVQCDFQDKDQSPYAKYQYDAYSSPKYTPQGKPLKRVMLAFGVVTTLSRPSILDTSEVVEGREYW